MPDNGTLDGSIKLIQDLAIRHATETSESPTHSVNRQEFSDFIRQYYSLPVDPQDAIAFMDFLEEAKRQLNGIVIGQERMISDVVDAYGQLIRNKEKNVSVVYALGVTGVGKTLLGTELARIVLQNKGAFFEINGNEYTSSHRMDALLGAPNGFVSSNKTPGALMEWLDDASRGGRGGIVLINEIDKMDVEGLKRLMEAWDRAKLVGGDGKVRSFKNIQFIVTSNRNATMIFPESWPTWTAAEMAAHVASLDSDGLKEKATINSTGGQDDKQLSPEVLNRIDLFTLGVPITKDVALLIAQQLLERSNQEFAEDFGLRLELEPEVLQRLVDHSYNHLFGARPIVRVVGKYLQDFTYGYVRATGGNPAAGEGGEPLTVPVGLVADAESEIFSLAEGAHTLPAPKVGTLDPLADPEFVEEILRFEEEMNQYIFGQEEMISRISEAIIAHAGDAENNQRALSIMAIGSTGTGKSETAKAIAQVKYKSRERTGYVNLGKVRFEGDFNRVFNPPPGYQGANQIGEFERALLNNPQGGVILFDEVSNMGAGSPADKEAAFKLLYEITDEPTWTSSATGETYDLRKYIFFFTGNDGEGIFSGLGSDDLRLAEWEENRSGARVRKILRDSGVPEAFIGRLADLILQKPLTREILSEKIAPKFLDPIFNKTGRWPGANLQVSPEFVAQFGTIFFTQDEGARSVRKVAESKLRALLVKVRAGLMRQGADSEVDVQLSLEDNLPETIFVENAGEFKRQVTLVAQAVKDGEVLVTERVDATEHADKVTLFTEAQARLTSFHEIGHAYVNDPSVSHENLAFISLQARDGYLGYARYTQVGTPQSFTKETLMARVATILAGSAAQQLAGFPVDSGMSQDLDQARKLIRAAILNSGLFPEFNAALGGAVKAKDRLPTHLEARFEEVAQSVFAESWQIAVNRLVENWGLVSKAAERLLAEGEMTGDRFQEILAEGATPDSPDAAHIEAARQYILTPSTEPRNQCIEHSEIRGEE